MDKSDKNRVLAMFVPFAIWLVYVIVSLLKR